MKWVSVLNPKHCRIGYANKHRLLTVVLERFQVELCSVIRMLNGSPNTYIYTKGVAEEMVRTRSQGLPVSVFRPSIGTSLLKQIIREQKTKDTNYLVEVKILSLPLLTPLTF